MTTTITPDPPHKSQAERSATLGWRPEPGGGGVMLARLARVTYRRRRLVVAVWVLAVVGLQVLSSRLGGDHRVDYAMPGSGSAEAQQLLAGRFPEQAGDTVQLVFHAEAGVGSPVVAARIAAAEREARAVPHVVDVRPAGVSADGKTALLTVQLDDTGERVPAAVVESLMDVADRSDGEGLAVDAGGWTVQNAEAGEASSEGVGMVAAVVILLIAFGSVLAAGLPLLVAVFGLGAAYGVIGLLTNWIMVPEWGTSLATMIGIGVGIDYALFIVTRYRGALAEGEEPEEAVLTAMTTSGRAVLFAGGTVVVSLLGLGVMGLEYLWGTAAATVTAVLTVLVATVTLLPAILGFCGRSIDRLRVPFVRGDRGERGLWARWSRVVQRRPVLTGAASLLVLVVLAVPALGLRFGFPDAGTGPSSLTSRRAYDRVASGFGPGVNGPLVVGVDLHDDGGVLERLRSAVAADPGVAAVLPAQVNAAADAAVIVVVPRTGPQEEATEALLGRLRDSVVPGAVGASAAVVHVGGAAAAFVDQSEYMGARLPWFIGAVIALSFVLLLVVFRSLLVALKAALMNVLAIGAAYGVMAVALQGGWLGQRLGIHEPTPVPVWVAVLMFAILFGLSMDYEVFLLSRIREEWLRTGDNAEAVAEGMARTGRIISAAGAIMVTVFGAYVASDQVFLKVTGLGLATAVLVDSTVVRMVLVPSTMELLGDRNWWLPRWLGRVLPRVDIEGHYRAPRPQSGRARVPASDPIPASVAGQ